MQNRYEEQRNTTGQDNQKLLSIWSGNGLVKAIVIGIIIVSYGISLTIDSAWPFLVFGLALAIVMLFVCIVQIGAELYPLEDRQHV